MIQLSSIAKQEKNKLSTGSAFIILLDIKLGTDTARICITRKTLHGTAIYIRRSRLSSGTFLKTRTEGHRKCS